jgi:hypothetical protein
MYDLDDIEKDDDTKDELPEFMKPEDEGDDVERTDSGPEDAHSDIDDERDDDNEGNR